MQRSDHIYRSSRNLRAAYKMPSYQVVETFIKEQYVEDQRLQYPSPASSFWIETLDPAGWFRVLAGYGVNDPIEVLSFTRRGKKSFLPVERN